MLTDDAGIINYHYKATRVFTTDLALWRSNPGHVKSTMTFGPLGDD